MTIIAVMKESMGFSSGWTFTIRILGFATRYLPTLNNAIVKASGFSA